MQVESGEMAFAAGPSGSAGILFRVFQRACSTMEILLMLAVGLVAIIGLGTIVAAFDEPD